MWRTVVLITALASGSIVEGLLASSADAAGLYNGAIFEGFVDNQGSFTTLTGPAGVPFISANGINDSGQVVGDYDLNGSEYGYIYSGGTYTTLAGPTGSTSTQANGINNNGQIVGTYVNSTGTYSYLYSSGVYTTLSVPAGSIANGISNNGQIVGVLNSAHGFVETGNTYTTFVAPPGGTFISANGINNSGQIVGDYEGIGGEYGFVDNAGVYTTITYADGPFCFPGGCPSITSANGINDQGEVVGSYWFGLSRAGFPVDYIDQANGVEDNGINDFGMIVGDFSPTPLPDTLPLFATGMAAFGLLAWRRKRNKEI